MSKIEEMAIAYGKEHQGTVDIEVFEQGANYVLKHIEEATNICFDEELRNVIQQLKK